MYWVNRNYWVKILIVSSEQASASFIASVVINSGHKALITISTDEALRVYTNEMPDLVILDILMSAQDGYKVAELMRECDKTINTADSFYWVPIIFVSDSAQDIDINKGVLSGGDDYIVKPVTELKLHTKLFAFNRMVSMQKNVLRLQKITKDADKMEALSILSAGVAHEIRNPLGTLIQGGQNLSRRLDATLPSNKQVADELGVDINKIYEYAKNREIFKFIHEMKSAGERIADVVKSLLTLTNDTGEESYLNNINDLLESTLQIFYNEKSKPYKLDASKITIVKNFANNLPAVICCRSSLQTVFNNLLLNSAYGLNAVTHEPKITITSKLVNNYIEILFEDNGIGIKKENMKNLFAPFFTTKEVGQGMGIGLTVAYGVVVSRHSGELFIESEEGVGTKVTVHLPIKTQVC
jgi:signal transduction histidine kinase